MKNLKNIYRLPNTLLFGIFAIACIALLITACGATSQKGKTPTPEDAIGKTEADYDPLADSRDKKILETIEVTTPAEEIKQKDDFNWSQVDSFMQAQHLEDSILTIYRIQLFASQYYTEANYELQIANEVFNDSVFIKYDLPYYKVLLGNTTIERRGRRMLSTARSLGYYNSWLIESPPDSIYYRFLFVKDSIAAYDSLLLLQELDLDLELGE
jgi:hypothetical protein